MDSGFSDFSDCVTREQGEARLKSAVVHETHSVRDSSRLHHVSKVYFYSISDILQQHSSHLEDHLGLLKAEAAEESPNLEVTPRIDSSVCEEDFFDRVESPFLPISSPLGSHRASSPGSGRSRRVHTGTSSLRRGGRSPGSRAPTPSLSPFPLTNGSLCGEASQRRDRRRDLADSRESEASLPRDLHSDR